jgi:hypothetical protein
MRAYGTSFRSRLPVAVDEGLAGCQEWYSGAECFMQASGGGSALVSSETVQYRI